MSGPEEAKVEAYEFGYYDSIRGAWVVCGPQVGYPDGSAGHEWERLATPEEAADLEAASEWLAREYEERCA